MVGYDDENNALTLGDDDSLKVGDYEIRYNSTSDTFDVEYTPTGDTNSLTRSNSGSLFPTDLGDVVQGQALADDGNLYSSIQTAIDNATSYVLVGSGTFTETVTISTNEFTLEGVSSYGSTIDGGSLSNPPIDVVGANDVTVKNIGLTVSGTNGSDLLRADGTSARLRVDTLRLYDANNGNRGMNIQGVEVTVQNCLIDNIGSIAYWGRNDRQVWRNNIAIAPGNDCIAVPADDCVVSNNVFIDAGDNGVALNGSDNIAIGNRIHNSLNDGLITLGGGAADNIVANNRISDSGGSDLTDNATNTTLDANLTGVSN